MSIKYHLFYNYDFLTPVSILLDGVVRDIIPVAFLSSDDPHEGYLTYAPTETDLNLFTGDLSNMRLDFAAFDSSSWNGFENLASAHSADQPFMHASAITDLRTIRKIALILEAAGQDAITSMISSF